MHFLSIQSISLAEFILLNNNFLMNNFTYTILYLSNVTKSILKAGAKKETEPKKKPWGQTIAYVRELDGFLKECIHGW